MAKQLNRTAEDMNKFLPFLEGIESGDDKGINIIGGQIAVGKPDDARESVFGEGDSYPVPVAFHCDVADTAGLVITNAVDITTILQSDDGSTTGLFNGNTSGKYILVGSPYRYGGVKAKIATAGTIEPANAIGEYLQDNSPTWIESKYMATASGFPYTQRGRVLASVVGSEQWRFGYDPKGGIPTWDEVTLNINGTNYTYRWARFRLTAGITLDPQMEQIKLHTNRFEINADGNTEYFGRSRYSKDIQIEKRTNSQRNPANENISISSNMTEINTDNEFNNGADDGIILRGILPEGADTSIPVYVQVDWYPKGSNSGDVKLQLETTSVTPGSVMDGNNPVQVSTPIITTINNQEEEVQRSTFRVDVSAGLPGDLFYGDLHRNANDVEDTYGNNIVIMDWRVIGYFWRP